MDALSCSKCSSHNGHCAHTHSISQPNPRNAIYLAQLTKSVYPKKNSQRVLGRASWSRNCLKKLRNIHGTSSPRKRGRRGINTHHSKLAVVTVRLDRPDQSSRPVWLKLAATPQTGQTGPPDRSGPEKPRPLFIRPYLIHQVKT